MLIQKSLLVLSSSGEDRNSMLYLLQTANGPIGETMVGVPQSVFDLGLNEQKALQ